MSSKRKDAVALFEAISRTKPKLPEANMNVPGWMARQQQAPEPPKVPVPVASGRSLSELQQRASQLAGLPRTREPIFSTAGGRMRVSLNYVSGGVAAGGFVLLLLVAFLLGRSSASPGKSVEQPPPGAPPLNPAVVRGIEQGPSTGSPPARVKGKHYLIIQSMMGNTDRHKADAQKIVEFLHRNGEEAETRPTTSGSWVVLSFRPYDSPQSPEAIQFAQKIEELGKKYTSRAEGGQYDFRQRDRATGKLEPFYIKY